jgi:hypothetical protein
MIVMKIMTKKMRTMKMKTMEEVAMEIREEAREIMEAAAAAIEAQEDIALMMKITMTKIITMKTTTRIMTKKTMIGAAEVEAAAEVQVVVPAEDLAP